MYKAFLVSQSKHLPKTEKVTQLQPQQNRGAPPQLSVHVFRDAAIRVVVSFG